MVIKRVTGKDEILGIKNLQNQNLRSSLESVEIEKEGFVTAVYSLEFLELMNKFEPSIIAKDGDNVVGYALVATRDVVGHHDLLDDLFLQIDNLSYKDKKLVDVNYVVVGQLCVAKPYRRRGLSQKMYNYYRDELAGKYEYCLTDVDEGNPRSIKTHLKSGFQIISTLKYGGSKWYIIIWDWNKRSHDPVN